MASLEVFPPSTNQDYGSSVAPPPSVSSGAPTNAQYVTLATDATLTVERVLTAGNRITLTDNGAGSTVVIAGASQLQVLTPAYGATVTIDLTSYTLFNHVRVDVGSLTGNIILNITNGFNGQIIRVRLKQDATGGRTLTFGANIGASADLPAPLLSTGASKVDFLAFEWDGNDSLARLVAYVRGFT